MICPRCGSDSALVSSNAYYGSDEAEGVLVETIMTERRCLAGHDFFDVRFDKSDEDTFRKTEDA